MSSLSREALLNFLDYLSNKGLMNRTTVSARKAAANKVLGILDEVEATDISALNLEEVMDRFHNLAGEKYRPESLSAYKSRLKSAIDDFLRYQKDPMNFRPAVQASGKRGPERSKSSQTAKQPTHSDPRTVHINEAPPASVSVLPIPIRADLTVKIQGLPYDLTAQEANKIANVVKAMAVQD